MDGLPKHPGAGSVTGEYLENENGTVRVPAIIMMLGAYPEIKQDLATYKWNDSDFLLCSYPKTGTHSVWQVMAMLLNGSSEHIEDPKEVAMIDVFALSQSEIIFPSPRVLNTHYRTDVLSSEFRKAKTVIVMRNPKDACMSLFHHEIKLMPTLSSLYANLADLPFSDYVKGFLFDKDKPYGSYFDYTEYMWTLRDDPNHLVVFYEDLKLKPVDTIQKVYEFMDTNASPELVQEIAHASANLEELLKTLDLEGQSTDKANEMKQDIYKRGGIGDWKNHFTVADNEMFDEFLANWEGGKDIPFKYSPC